MVNETQTIYETGCVENSKCSALCNDDTTANSTTSCKVSIFSNKSMKTKYSDAF